MQFLYGNMTGSAGGANNKHEILRKTQALVHQHMDRDRRIYYGVARKKFAHNRRKIQILETAWVRERERLLNSQFDSTVRKVASNKVGEEDDGVVSKVDELL